MGEDSEPGILPTPEAISNFLFCWSSAKIGEMLSQHLPARNEAERSQAERSQAQRSEA